MNKGALFIAAVTFLGLNACATIPGPLAENIKYPHAFRSVGYRSTLDQQSLIAFEYIATLSVEIDRLVFRDKDIDVTILFSDIHNIEYKKIYLTDPSNWVIVRYKVGNLEKTALFSAFRFWGWVGGTQEIFEAIQLAYQRHMRSLGQQSNNTMQPTSYVGG